jgi:putative FmdB family regulatory protein
MPTYGYQCKSCSHEFEEFQRISDPPLVICPSCQKHSLIRIIAGGAGLVFKGSGFYLTDYKKQNSSPSGSSGSGKSTASGSGGSSESSGSSGTSGSPPASDGAGTKKSE